MEAVSIVNVTPRIAKDIIEKTKGKPQRVLSASTVDSYASEMEAGFWEYTGESISISKDGACLNGQHRLHAIVQSQTTIQMPVSTGINPDVFKVIDTAKSRTTAEILGIAGYINTHVLAAATRSLLTFYLHGVIERSSVSGGSLSYTSHTVTDFNNKNKAFSDFINDKTKGVYVPLRREKNSHYSFILGFIYPLWVRMPEKVEAFLEGVSLCENIKIDDPRMRLSKFLVSEKMKRPGVQKTLRAGTLSMWVQAWNDYANSTYRKRFQPSVKIPKPAHFNFGKEITFPDEILEIKP